MRTIDVFRPFFIRENLFFITQFLDTFDVCRKTDSTNQIIIVHGPNHH